MKNQQTVQKSGTTPTTVTQINNDNNSNKTLTPSQQQQVHTATGLAGGSIVTTIITIITVISGLIYKMLKNKKVKKGIVDTIADIEKEYQKVREEWQDKRHKILTDPTKLLDHKTEDLLKIEQEYTQKITDIKTKYENLKERLKEGK